MKEIDQHYSFLLYVKDIKFSVNGLLKLNLNVLQKHYISLFNNTEIKNPK